LNAAAELVADGGEAAAGEEFFRCRPFLAAEGVTHTLRIAGDGVELLAPLLVREVPGGEGLDAISPYGYPGIAVTLPGEVGRPAEAGEALEADRAGQGAPGLTPAIDPGEIDFSATGLVSAFIRHTLADPPLRGASERNMVQIADPALPPKSRMSDRQQIRRNLKRGYELRAVPGPQTSGEERAGFLAAYEQTMRRTEAAERYFFAAAYFDLVLAAEGTWLVSALAPDGELAAASIAARSDGFLHYYLSGSADSHLRDSPMKNIVASLCELSAAEGLPLNLGGGISPGDPLEEFKRGFANREQAWRTSEVVCDPEAYERLSAGRAAGGFFPAYRAP
jgi:hypothetical protein